MHDQTGHPNNLRLTPVRTRPRPGDAPRTHRASPPWSRMAGRSGGAVVSDGSRLAHAIECICL
ncbi:hypothetical protein SFR_2927 [Streptomyces sp. FR-008]|nr:hypothetical protein SFR_2927 [Streptomyces sp. FR-008]